jgi:hypothetical protein
VRFPPHVAVAPGTEDGVPASPASPLAAAETAPQSPSVAAAAASGDDVVPIEAPPAATVPGPSIADDLD